MQKFCKGEANLAGQHLGFCSRGGKIAVFAYQGGGGGGGKRYMLYNTIYIVKFQGGANIQQERENAPPLNETLLGVFKKRGGAGAQLQAASEGALEDNVKLVW